MAISVVILRRHGRRIPAEALLDVQHPIGHLVCQQRGDHWHADLYANPRSGDQVYVGGHELSLGFVTLERESGGTRLYRGGVWEGRKLVAQSQARGRRGVVRSLAVTPFTAR